MLTHRYEWVRVPCAVALWQIGGEAEAATVVDTLLRAWQQNSATASHVVACLDRMGPAAEPALPLLRAHLAQPQRFDWFGRIDIDEELQRAGRAIIARFA